MIRKIRLGVLLVVAALAIAIAAPATAGGKASLRINEPNTYDFGEEITFSVENARTDTPWVIVECYQGGDRVYYEGHGMWDGAMGGHTFTLGPSVAWQGGDADCVAEMGDFNRRGFKTQAKLEFHVYG